MIANVKPHALLQRTNLSAIACGIALLLMPVLSRAAPLPAGGAVPSSPSQAIVELSPHASQVRGGIYALEPSLSFNSLDEVSYDPASGRLSLVGHFDPRFIGPPIPYFQYLAALLELKSPRAELHFSLETSRATRDALRTRVASTPFARRSVLPYFAKVFDQQGIVTHLGASMLSSLGLSPVQQHRPPGYFGANVEALPSGAVRIVSLYEGAPADLAGLQKGDQITRFNGRTPFSAQELERLVRFGGAHSKVTITYLRDGRAADAAVELLPDDVSDPWNQATRGDVEAILDRKADKADRANVAYLLGVLGSNLGAPARLAVLAELARALGVEQAATPALTDGAAGRAVAPPNEAQAARQVLSRLDALYGLSDAPSAAAYDASFANAGNPVNALKSALQAFAAKAPATTDRLGEMALGESAGFQVPPEIFEAIYQAHVESVPEYFGESPHTLLARLMFEADYAVLKRLPHRPDLKERLPSYQTLFDYGAKHPKDFQGAVVSRVWISVAKMSVAQSASGTTLVIREAKMRFNRRRMTPDGRDAEEDSGYESLMTSIYDDIAQDYFSLHELREAAKLAAAAAWMRQKNPNVRMPSEGRVAWNGPQKVPGMTYLHTPAKDSTDVLFIAHGGVNLTPFPLGNAGLPIPTDSAVQDDASLRAPPPPDLQAPTVAPADPPPQAAWTDSRKVKGRQVGVAGVALPLASADMSDLHDAVASPSAVSPKATVEERKRKLLKKLEHDRGNPAAEADDLLQLARLAFFDNDVKAALALNRQAAAFNPPGSLYLIEQARYEDILGDRQSAIASLQRAIVIDPGNTGAKNILAKWKAQEQRGIIPAGPAPPANPSPTSSEQPVIPGQPSQTGPRSVAQQPTMPGQPTQSAQQPATPGRPGPAAQQPATPPQPGQAGQQPVAPGMQPGDVGLRPGQPPVTPGQAGAPGQAGQQPVATGVQPGDAGLPPGSTTPSATGQVRAGFAAGSNRAMQEANAVLGEQKNATASPSGCYDASAPGCTPSNSPDAVVVPSTPTAKPVPGTPTKPPDALTRRNDAQRAISAYNSTPNPTPRQKADFDAAMKAFTQAQSELDNPASGPAPATGPPRDVPVPPQTPPAADYCTAGVDCPK